jgi:hypothetical protein
MEVAQDHIQWQAFLLVLLLVEPSGSASKMLVKIGV